MTLVYTKDVERQEQMRKQIEFYDSMLLLGQISEEQYDKEMRIFSEEVDSMSLRQDKLNGKCSALDSIMQNPMQDVNKLLEESEGLFK